MTFDESTKLVTVIISLISIAVSIATGARTLRLQQEFTIQREEAARRSQREDVMARYREPVLRSAVDLQSRLYNIARNKFLHIYFNTTDAERTYASTSTLYVIAEYFGWVEILRREIQYLDQGELVANQRLAELLEAVTTTFLTDEVENSLRLFRGEQRAIGEIMLVSRPAGSQSRYECLGYAAFTEKLKEPAFAQWFTKLEEDVKQLAKREDVADRRLLRLQHALIDLIDFLDPNRARVPERRRKKLPLATVPAARPDTSGRPETPDLAGAGAALSRR